MAASTSPVVTYPKDPAALLDYSIDWTRWLGEDTIVNSVWTVPAGISNAGSFSSTTLNTIWLSGGTPGVSYSIYNVITTALGRTDKRTVKINVIDR